MRIRYTAIIGTMMAASLLLLCASVACGKVDHERIAEDVAREWATTEAESISEEIAAMATRRYGARVFVQIVDDESFSPSNASAVGNLRRGERLPMSADTSQIQETIQWEFDTPAKNEDGRYEIIATASVSFDIVPSGSSGVLLATPDTLLPMLRTHHSGSVDYRLEIDTTTREVSSAKMPLYSVRIYRIPPEVNLN